MKKDENKKAINFLIDKDKAKSISAFAMKEDLTLATFIECLIDNYINVILYWS